ncbi:DUF397 domain-containing protein [Streptomyces sp. NBC_01614]|uniref:DUF397 domain-containing protein n=1 Tax=Streptomyces sp. NBC_00180 TaxID=2903632 RepID=A0AAU1HYY7_9ACTN
MTPTLKWFKSSYSSNEGPECVEVAIPPSAATILVRDSKDKDGARLAFEASSWAEFIDGMSTMP